MMKRSVLFLSTVVLTSGLSAMAAGKVSQKLPKKATAPVTTTAATPAAPAANTTVVQVTGAIEKAGENLSNSEANFHPALGNSSLDAQLDYQTLNANYRVGDAGNKSKFSEKYEGFLTVARYNRGLQNQWAFQAQVGVGNQTVSHDDLRDAKATGLTDFQFKFQKLQQTGNTQLFYGSEATFSPGDRKWAVAYKGGSSYDGNLYSGGHSFAPFIAAQKDFGTYVAGAKAQYHYFLDRSESYTLPNNFDVNVTRTNGHTLSLSGFYEHPRAKFLLGGKGGLDMVSGSGMDLSAKGAKLSYSTDSYYALNLGVYGRMALDKSVEVIPSLTYRKPLASSGGSMDIQDDSADTNLSVAARWAL